MTLYRAATRLHFGLIHVPIPGLNVWPDGTAVRKYGGVGLMLQSPSIEVQLEPAPAWSCEGSLGERSLRLATHLTTTPYHIVANGPLEHVGLGVGTALGLCVAKAMTGETNLTELAKLTGRGERSGIGLHGSSHGGLIVDGGKWNDELPTLLEAIPFPAEWVVVLLRPHQVETPWAGDRERIAFKRKRDPVKAFEQMQELRNYQQVIAKAVKAKDMATFGEAVHHFNKLAGAPFVEDQGGPYASTEIETLIAKLRAMGIAGVGQSSWGPTVFAFVEGLTNANAIAETFALENKTLADVMVTSAQPGG